MALHLQGETPGVDADIRGASLKATIDFSAGTLTSLTGFTNSGVRAAVSSGSYSPACYAEFVCDNALIQPRDQAVSQEFDFASKKVGGFSYVTGVFAIYDNQREHDSYNVGVFSDDTTIVTHAGAIFGEGTYEWTDQFSTIVGVRVSRDSLNAVGRDGTTPFAEYADKSWDSVTPGASLIYKFNSNLNAYFTYSQGFKAGIVSGQIGTAPYPPPASPEKIYAYEVGLKAATDTYTANLAAFYYDYKDLQIEIFNDQVTIPENASSAEILWTRLRRHRETHRLVFNCGCRARGSRPRSTSRSRTPTAFVPPLGPFGLVTDNNYVANNSHMLDIARVHGNAGRYVREKLRLQGRFEATGTVYHSSRHRWEFTNSVTTESLLAARRQLDVFAEREPLQVHPVRQEPGEQGLRAGRARDQYLLAPRTYKEALDERSNDIRYERLFPELGFGKSCAD